MKSLLTVLLLIICSAQAVGQTASVRGFVTSADDGEALQGVNVILDDEQGEATGVASNEDGFFLISRVSPGRYLLRASFIGFTASVDTLTIKAGDRLVVNVALRSGSIEMDEIAVEAEREGGAARLTAGLQTVQARDIELIPTPDVSGDLATYLTAMPGVVVMGDRGGQVFIRGGEPTQNIVVLDGMDILQPFHILGFYSAIPAEIVSTADVYAGGFPARHMGRISSVIDVRTRNGNKRTIGAAASISPFTGSARLEGPVIKGRMSFVGAARMSTLDRIAQHYVDDPLPYEFEDWFGKLHVVAGDNVQLSVTGIHTYDSGTLLSEEDFFERDEVIRWRNTAIGGRYLVSPRAFSVLGEFLVSYSRLQSEFGPAGFVTRTSDVQLVSTALNMTYFAGRSEVAYGFFLRAPTTSAELDGLYQNLITRDYISTHTGGYIDSEIYLGAGLRVRPGVSVQVYGSAAPSFEPRLRARWDRGSHHLSGAAGLYRQHLVGLSDRRDATSIFTAWIETPFNKAMSALHMLLGYRLEVSSGIELSVEAFRKELDNLFISEWTAFPSFTTRLQTASGSVNGFDARLELAGKQFYGFVNYGYSSSLYDVDPESPAQLDPGPFRPPHDRRHQVNVLATADLLGFRLTTRWQFGSGLPYTPVAGFDGFILMDGAVDVARIRGFPRVIYERIPYQAELPAYHRLDVSIERSFDLMLGTQMTVMAGVLNAYDRANLFALDLLTAKRSDQLPLVPIVGMKLEL